MSATAEYKLTVLIQYSAKSGLKKLSFWRTACVVNFINGEGLLNEL
jgi:hypothetical protein